MPRKARTEAEINVIKDRILQKALELIQERGLEGFTMRRLASRLGIRAVTIYNYYESKDHLYLAVLTKGFRLLYDDCIAAYRSKEDSMARLQAMMETYLQFGLEQAHFYNLMFTWHVPKYQDYVGTPMEAAARRELAESEKVYLLFIRAVKELIEPVGKATDSQLRSYIIYFWSALHGYIAGINNSLLSYMHKNPLGLKETILENLAKHIQQEIRDNLTQQQIA